MELSVRMHKICVLNIQAFQMQLVHRLRQKQINLVGIKARIVLVLLQHVMMILTMLQQKIAKNMCLIVDIMALDVF